MQSRLSCAERTGCYVILSEVVVREADGNVVEGSLRSHRLPIPSRTQLQCGKAYAADTLVGILRLRSCSTSWSSFFAQDDKALYFPVRSYQRTCNISRNMREPSTTGLMRVSPLWPQATGISCTLNSNLRARKRISGSNHQRSVFCRGKIF